MTIFESFKVYYFPLAIILLLASCKHDDDEPALTKTDLLTGGSGKWKLTALKGTTVGGTADLYNTSMDACEKDNIYYFKKDLTYQILEGAAKCFSGDPDIVEAGTWLINSDQTQLTMTTDNSPETVTIDKLDNTTFVTTATLLLAGQSLVLNATYTKQ